MGKPGPDSDHDRRAALSIVAVSRETEARLAAYVDLLCRWQTIKNLVGSSTLDAIWTRHIADSAQLVTLAPDALRWVDLGSGAGFPGLVVAILLCGRPGARVDLIESNERKCAFLREAVRLTAAPARVHMGRIADVLPRIERPVEIVTARALAALPELLAMSEALLSGGTRGLFLVGDDSDRGHPRMQSGEGGLHSQPHASHRQDRLGPGTGGPALDMRRTTWG